MAVATALSLAVSSVAEVIEGSLAPATYVPGGNANLAMYWVSVKETVCVRWLIQWLGRWNQ